MRVDYEKLARMLKSVVLKFRSDIPARFSDIAEQHVLAKLKPITIVGGIKSVVENALIIMWNFLR